jgi:HK97 gp10 family phage protein
MPKDLEADLEAVAQDTGQRARGRAPVKTGKLRSSIFVSRGAEGNTFVVGTPMYYAKFLEWGTKHMKARPFLNVSFRAAMSKLDARIRQWGQVTK